MSRYEAQAHPVGIKWDGVEHESIGQDGTTSAISHYPVRLIIELPARDLTGLDLTQPITITQEKR